MVLAKSRLTLKLIGIIEAINNPYLNIYIYHYFVYPLKTTKIIAITTITPKRNLLIKLISSSSFPLFVLGCLTFSEGLVSLPVKITNPHISPFAITQFYQTVFVKFKE